MPPPGRHCSYLVSGYLRDYHLLVKLKCRVLDACRPASFVGASLEEIATHPDARAKKSPRQSRGSGVCASQTQTGCRQTSTARQHNLLIQPAVVLGNLLFESACEVHCQSCTAYRCLSSHWVARGGLGHARPDAACTDSAEGTGFLSLKSHDVAARRRGDGRYGQGLGSRGRESAPGFCLRLRSLWRETTGSCRHQRTPLYFQFRGPVTPHTAPPRSLPLH